MVLVLVLVRGIRFRFRFGEQKTLLSKRVLLSKPPPIFRFVLSRLEFRGLGSIGCRAILEG